MTRIKENSSTGDGDNRRIVNFQMTYVDKRPPIHFQTPRNVLEGNTDWWRSQIHDAIIHEMVELYFSLDVVRFISPRPPISYPIIIINYGILSGELTVPRPTSRPSVTKIGPWPQQTRLGCVPSTSISAPCICWQSLAEERNPTSRIILAIPYFVTLPSY